MKFTAPLAAELAALTAALDEPGADIGYGLHQLAAQAALAVSSYLGLSVVVTRHESSDTVTLFDHAAMAGDIGASLVLALPGVGARDDAAAVAFILYARTPGAFVDLAADVAWLTGRPRTDFALDEHLSVPAAPDTATFLAADSVINQAIGVLIGRGYTIEEAQGELDAARSGMDRLASAHQILSRLAPGGDDRPDSR